MASCPQWPRVERFVAGRDGHTDQDAIEAHLATCAECRERMDAIADVGSIVPRAAPERLHRSNDSAALRRVIDNARNESASVSAISQWPFLKPASEPGFIGELGPYPIRRV